MLKLHFFVSKRTGKLPVYCTSKAVKQVDWNGKVWSRLENFLSRFVIFLLKNGEIAFSIL